MVMQDTDRAAPLAPDLPTHRPGALQVQDAIRARYEALAPSHMPNDFSISLDGYRKGGTDRINGRTPVGLRSQSMRGFEPGYVNIVDYIIRITHRIWEEKDIGYIYDTYSHDCTVWDDFGLQCGRDKVIADTIQTNNAFPDIRIVADDVIWAGDENVGFHTSHRSSIIGTNTGYSRFGEPTGKRVQIWCIANCVSRDNEIFHEYVVYDTAAIIRQIGLDVLEWARRSAPLCTAAPQNFIASEPRRMLGQGKPPAVAIPAPEDSIDTFVRAAFQTIWNRRNFAAIDQVYAPNIVSQGSGCRVYRGTGQIRSHVLSLIAMFPDLHLAVDDVYWMGNAKDGYTVSVRWSAQGSHRGHGPYGDPTGRQISLWGINNWVIESGVVQKEWMMFNEFGILMQIHR